jgi:hypothetical protein
MTPDERAKLILAFARVLFVNGETTDQVIGAGRRFANRLGVRAELLPRWGDLQLPYCARDLNRSAAGAYAAPGVAAGRSAEHHGFVMA